MTTVPMYRGQAPTTSRAQRLPVATVVLPTAVALTLWAVRARTVAPVAPYLGFNLLLAWVPWALSAWATRRPRALPTMLALSALWLIALPNAPYLLTDLVHLKERHGVPLSYDVLVFAAFALAGCTLGWVSLKHMHDAWRTRVTRRWLLALDLSVIWLTGFGVYLGRFVRLNSWSVVTEPVPLASEVIDALSNPEALAFSCAFAALFGAGFLLLLTPAPTNGESALTLTR